MRKEEIEVTADERIWIHLMKNIKKETDFNNIITESEISNDSYYKMIEKDCSSQVYSVSSPKEMVEYINRIIRNEVVANCITAKTFYDLYEKQSISAKIGCSKEETKENVIEIPAYTYTL